MGKGGGSAPAPTSQTVQQSNIPEYARPYFEDIMTRGTTASNVAYQPYTGERVAPFSPLQQQAFQGIQNLGPSPLLQPAAGLTGAAGIGGLGAGAQYTQQATSPGAMQAYMSPYMQNVVDWQKTQAIQDYGRQLPGQQAAATRAGAFGGSRQAIVEAEAQRNLQNQLGGIQAQGTQAAFDQANKNLQFGSQLGLQGLGLAGQMGQQFGQLGQTAFGQQAAAAQAQQQAGAIQQAQGQQQRDLAYEEFMRQQLYPQSQLQFLSSLLRGSVVAPQQTMYSYQAQPSMVSQLGGLGLGALGLSKAFGAKEGGEVPGYADGGDVEGFAEGGVASNVAKLTKFLMASQNPEQDVRRMSGTPIEKYLALQKVQQLRGATQNQAALDRGVPQGTVMDEMGLAGMDAGVMDGEYAGGGIVAFKDGKEVPGGQAEFDITDPLGIFSGLKALYNRPRSYATPGEEARARRLAESYPQGLYGTGLPEVTTSPSGIAAALPQPVASPDQLQGRPANRPEDFARPAAAPMSTAPDAQKVPAARPSITPGQTIKPAEDELMKFNKIEKLDPAAREAEYRKAMEEKFPSELKERLDEYKSQAAQAREDRDADRWLAVAMGGFAAAAGQSPYALQNFAQGLGLTTKEMATINKDFRKAEDLRNKAIREERKADRLERMGMEEKAMQTRQMAEKYNLDVEKANQSLQAHLAQTKAYREATASRERTSMAQIGETAGLRRDMQAAQLAAQERDKILGAQAKIEKGLEQFNTELDTLKLAKAKGATTMPVKGKGDVPIDTLIQNITAARQAARRELEKDYRIPEAGAVTAPKPGAVMSGYRFKGGDPSKQESWEKI